MTNRYILDENVVIYAQRGENESGEIDATCMTLIEQIIDICRILVLDPNLWSKYHNQLSQPRHAHPPEGFRLLRVIRDAVRIAGKVEIRRSNAAPFPQETSIPQGSQDDRDIVRLAVETLATLVTTDVPLRNDLNSWGIEEAYGLQVLSPDEVLKDL